jgi:membrane-bound lytic murein transglycosylase F
MFQHRLHKLLWLLGLCISAFSSCSTDENTSVTPSTDQSRPASLTYIETGDLKAFRKRGELRILVPGYHPVDHYLPRKGSPLGYEYNLADKFSRKMGLTARFVYVDSFGELIPALLAGKGDMIAANLTITEPRKQQIEFTVPIGSAFEQLVIRSEENDIHSVSDLKGRILSVRPNTSFWNTAQGLQKLLPDVMIQALPVKLSNDQILDMLSVGEIDATIFDSNILEANLLYRDDCKAAFNLTDKRILAWGVRPKNPELLAALNRFLNQERLTQYRVQSHLDDIEGIKKRKTVRILTRNNAASYFLWRGQLLGFEYELAKEFARQNGVRLEVVVAPSHNALIPMLREGKGDVIAALMSPTEQRRKLGVVFSRPYLYASEMVVARSSEKVFNGVEHLKGRTLVVRPSSAYWQTLQDIRAQGIKFTLMKAPEDMETEEIIDKVANGEYDLTVADSTLLEIELTWRDDIKGVLTLTDPQPCAWAVRTNNPKLLKAINKYFKKEYHGLFYNITYKKYFNSPHAVLKHREHRYDIDTGGQLSPYDTIVKKYAEKYGFDWRLLVSQMYQESRFDPTRKSWAGAVGLMQVMPRTAKEVGFTEIKDLETGIHAGVKYLDWVRDRFSEELPVVERMWFSLASYNAGPGHVHDARRLARQKGWNPDRWFNNVERAMLLLSKRKYAKMARFGYVRGREPVNYVRDIRDRFHAYTRLSGTQDRAKTKDELPRENTPNAKPS